MDDYQKMRPKKPLHYNPENYYVATILGMEREITEEQVTAVFGENTLKQLDLGIIFVEKVTLERANGAKK